MLDFLISLSFVTFLLTIIYCIQQSICVFSFPNNKKKKKHSAEYLMLDIQYSKMQNEKLNSKIQKTLERYKDL